MKNLKFILPALLVFVSEQLTGSASIVWDNKMVMGGTSSNIIDAVQTAYGTCTAITLQNGYSGLIRMNGSSVQVGPIVSSMLATSIVYDPSASLIYLLGNVVLPTGYTATCIEKYDVITLNFISRVTYNFLNNGVNDETAVKGAVDHNNLYVVGSANLPGFGAELTFLKINPSGNILSHVIKAFVPGTDIPIDCGLMPDPGSGVLAFYVCGASSRTLGPGWFDQVAFVGKYSAVNFSTIWEREDNFNNDPLFGQDIWNDMELFNYGIHLAGTMFHIHDIKANYERLSWGGLLTGSFAMDDVDNNLQGKALKVQVDNIGIPFLAIVRKVPDPLLFEPEKFILDIVKLNNVTFPATVIFDRQIEVGNCDDLIIFHDMDISPDYQTIFFTGIFSNCFLPSGSPFTGSVSASTGILNWFNFVNVPGETRARGKRVFAINSTDCIVAMDLASTIFTPDTSFLNTRRYTTVSPRLASNINEWNAENSDQINIYPNPTSGNVHLNSESEINKISIYDLAGSLIQEIDENMIFETDLDVSFLKPGVYMLMAATRESQTTLKLVKQ